MSVHLTTIAEVLILTQTENVVLTMSLEKLMARRGRERPSIEKQRQPKLRVSMGCLPIKSMEEHTLSFA